MKKLKAVLLISYFVLILLWIPAASFGLDAGDKAPLFSGNSTQGKIQLTDFLGKKNVVLALYFAVFTPVWTDELIAFQRDLEEFEKLDGQIIGVSTDSMDTHRKFADENGIDFPLISDEDKTIKKRYGWGRITYLIDKSGVIRFLQKGVPKIQDFLNELKQLP